MAACDERRQTSAAAGGARCPQPVGVLPETGFDANGSFPRLERAPSDLSGGQCDYALAIARPWRWWRNWLRGSIGLRRGLLICGRRPLGFGDLVGSLV